MRQNRFISALLIVTMLAVVPGAVAQPGTAELKLPVPKTFEFTHVEPAHYAAALGKDPAKIFAFVRDQIGYEVYTGVLRGPRGTLLAMAGNSLDRAALLASLLEQSGQKIRFARGTLPEARARDLVNSMWTPRPVPVASPDMNVPAELKNLGDTLKESVRRDYLLVYDQLKKAGHVFSSGAEPSVETLVKEAQAHYWVQWQQGAAWTDLDPSFRDSSPGRSSTRAAATMGSLPENLFHRVEFRVRLEEHDGEKLATRHILSFNTKAQELSGIDLVLSHQPENWSGPATSLDSAIAGAIQDTGKIKPVLVPPGEKPIVGSAFRPKPPAGGLGSISIMLGGEGTRRPLVLATAEYLDLTFISPGGARETVVRDIFDLIGRGRRAQGVTLSADEVKKLTETAPDLRRAVYDIFVTTGRVDASHITGVVTTEDKVPDTRMILKRINLSFTTVSDSFTRRLGWRDTAEVLFYPDSPRVTIVEISEKGQAVRVAMDLRRDRARGVVMGPRKDLLANMRIYRGIVNGTLERVLMEYGTGAAPRESKLGHGVSTSALFARAQSERVPTLLLPRERGNLQAGVTENALALLTEDAARGALAIAPQRPISVDGLLRFGWWRIDAQSGETTALTDEGLHQGEAQFFYRIPGTMTLGVYFMEASGMVFRYMPYTSIAGLMRAIHHLLFIARATEIPPPTLPPN